MAAVEYGPYGFRITRRLTTDPEAKFFRLQAQVHDAIGLSAAVFRYEVIGRTQEGTYALEFNGVCTPLDLEQWPSDPPEIDAPTYPKFVRTDKLDLIFPRVEFLAEAWTVLLEEASNLVRDLDSLDALSEDITVTFGNPETDSGPDTWWE